MPIFHFKHIFKIFNLARWLPPDDLRESIFFLASWIGYMSVPLLPLYLHIFKIYLILDIWIVFLFLVWSSFLSKCFFILLPTSNPAVTLLRFFFPTKNFFDRVCSKIAPSDVPLAAPMGVGPFILLLFIFSILFLMPNEVCTLGLYRLMKLLGTSNHHLLFGACAFISFLSLVPTSGSWLDPVCSGPFTFCILRIWVSLCSFLHSNCWSFRLIRFYIFSHPCWLNMITNYFPFSSLPRPSCYPRLNHDQPRFATSNSVILTLWLSKSICTTRYYPGGCLTTPFQKCFNPGGFLIPQQRRPY